MDKASDFGSEDWGFESLRGRVFFFLKIQIAEKISSKYVELSRLSNKNSSSLSGRLRLKSHLCLYYKKNVNVTSISGVSEQKLFCKIKEGTLSEILTKQLSSLLAIGYSFCGEEEK